MIVLLNIYLLGMLVCILCSAVKLSMMPYEEGLPPTPWELIKRSDFFSALWGLFLLSWIGVIGILISRNE